jgi:hypothetical protein
MKAARSASSHVAYGVVLAEWVRALAPDGVELLHG